MSMAAVATYGSRPAVSYTVTFNEKDPESQRGNLQRQGEPWLTCWPI